MGNNPQTRPSRERGMSGITVPSFNSSEVAHDLVKRIAGHCWSGKGDMIDRVFDAITDHYPDWTRRRVRGLFHKEAAKIDWREIRELEVISEIERERREVVVTARDEHHEFLRRISSTMDRMETEDAEFYQAQRDALRRMAGGGAQSASGNASRQGNKDIVARGPLVGMADQC